METYPTKEHIGDLIGKEMDEIYHKERKVNRLVEMFNRKLESEDGTTSLSLEKA